MKRRHNIDLEAKFLTSATVYRIAAHMWPDRRKEMLQKARADLKASRAYRFYRNFRPAWG